MASITTTGMGFEPPSPSVVRCTPGADPGFQVRGGGALKKIVPSGGRCEKFWGISCEKSRFYPKKIIFLPILGGGTRRVHPPPESAPVLDTTLWDAAC